MVILSDQSIMTFGKYKGKALVAVPAHYLLWLYEQPSFDKLSPLGNYIYSNWSALQIEINKKKK